MTPGNRIAIVVSTLFFIVLGLATGPALAEESDLDGYTVNGILAYRF